jgi:YD repeat-containing protein
MPKNSRALFKAFFLILLSCPPPSPSAQEKTGEPDSRVWYISNASGMTLEQIPSGFAALRNEYSLSVGSAPASEAPEQLLPYWDPSFRIELRVLYEKGGEIRRQWIFRDEKGTARLNASGSGGIFGGVSGENEKQAGFIEVYNEGRYITEERQFPGDGTELVFRFSYTGNALVKAESWILEAAPGAEGGGTGLVPVTTDYYRYTRSNSLRAIERLYHSEAGASESNKARVPFPAISPGFSKSVEFVNPGAVYSSEFFRDIVLPTGAHVTYATDSRGRVQSEIRKDNEGTVEAEILNTWSGDRLESVHWKSADSEGVTEFEYDAQGNRVMERNYRSGVLERAVRSEGNRDIEELYINGEAVLRAVWEEGRKISETRIRTGKDSR